MEIRDAYDLFDLEYDASIEVKQEKIHETMTNVAARVAGAASPVLKQKLIEMQRQLERAAEIINATNIERNEDINELPVSSKYSIKQSVSDLEGQLILERYILDNESESNQNGRYLYATDKSTGERCHIRISHGDWSNAKRRLIEKSLESRKSIVLKNLERLVEYDVTENRCIEVYAEVDGATPVSGDGYQGGISGVDKDSVWGLIEHLLDTLTELHQYRVHGDISKESIWIVNDKPVLSGLPIPHATALRSGRSLRSIEPTPDSIRDDLIATANMITELLIDAEVTQQDDVSEVLKSVGRGTSKVRIKSAAELKVHLQLARKSWLTRKFSKTSTKISAVLSVSVCALVIALWSPVHDMIKSSGERRDLVMQMVAEMQNGINQYERDMHSVDSELKRVIQELQRYKPSSNSERSITLAAKMRMLESTKKLIDEHLIQRSDTSSIKGQIEVIKQYLSEKSYDVAYERALPLHERIKKSISGLLVASNYIDAQSELEAVRKYIDRFKDNIELDEIVVDRFEAVIADELSAGDIVGSLEDGVKPLLSYYNNVVSDYKMKAASSAAAVTNEFVSEISKNMVLIPSGSYRMGYKKAGAYDARPVHSVNIAQFKVGKYPVTLREYRYYLTASGVSKRSMQGTDNHPVTNVSWKDAMSYISWLNKVSGKRYRLLTESEWEYIARHGNDAIYPWGNALGANNAVCSTCGSKWDNRSAAPVGSFRVNNFGVSDMYGNVWEWVQDCYIDSYRGAPSNGEARESGKCKMRVLRGGAWDSSKDEMHPAYRSAATPVFSSRTIGFRIAE